MVSGVLSRFVGQALVLLLVDLYPRTVPLSVGVGQRLR